MWKYELAVDFFTLSLIGTVLGTVGWNERKIRILKVDSINQFRFYKM